MKLHIHKWIVASGGLEGDELWVSIIRSEFWPDVRQGLEEDGRLWLAVLESDPGQTTVVSEMAPPGVPAAHRRLWSKSDVIKVLRNAFASEEKGTRCDNYNIEVCDHWSTRMSRCQFA